MKLTLKSQRGIAHLALILVVLVAVVVASAGYFVVAKNKDNKATPKTADAAGAAYICGSGYGSEHITYSGNGWRILSYKKAGAPADQTGCAVVHKNYGGKLYGKTHTMTLRVTSNYKISTRTGTNCHNALHDIYAYCRYDVGSYKYYAGPIYYTHKAGVKLYGQVNGYGSASYTIK